ncbi:MAG TPA: hypothetical protein VIK55_18860 [Paludibacter sp.]
MAFKCKIGFHSWNGCKCSECGKTRDEQHDWSKDCEKCSKCDKTNENQHDWSKDCEKCSKCSKTRDEQHDWSIDCEKCSKCGKTNENQHDWSKNCEKCSLCHLNRDGEHNFENYICVKCGYVCFPKNAKAHDVDPNFKEICNEKITLALSKDDFWAKFVLHDLWKSISWPSSDTMSSFGRNLNSIADLILGSSARTPSLPEKYIYDNSALRLTVRSAETTIFILEANSISLTNTELKIYWYNTNEFLPLPNNNQCRYWCITTLDKIQALVSF